MTPFEGAQQECDIVMKGGVTSGVVYPLTVVELAKRYRLRSIGGTSAGALAAAITAAAEFNRAGDGFGKIEKIP
jgi:predicted acylesterase/phospholipase RssA